MENVIYTLLKLARLDAGIIQMEKAEENDFRSHARCFGTI